MKNITPMECFTTSYKKPPRTPSPGLYASINPHRFNKKVEKEQEVETV